MSKFEPLHQAHAIDEVQIGIRFLTPLDARVIAKIREAMNQFGGDSDLPGHVELQQLSFGVFPPGQMDSRVASQGFLKRRTAPNGVALVELVVEAGSIAFRTTQYSRWHEVWSEYSKYINAISGAVSTIQNEVLLAALSLNYVDKFVWDGDDVSMCVPRLLLRPNSPYVSPHVFDKKDLWHSHTGEFQPIEAKCKRLLNLNLDCVDEAINGQMRRVIRITTALTDLYNQPELEASALRVEDFVGTLSTVFTDLHTRSKNYFKDVVSEQMCDRVALNQS